MTDVVPRSPWHPTEVLEVFLTLNNYVTYLLPHHSFCFNYHQGCIVLGLVVHISCFQSTTGQRSWKGHLLQLDISLQLPGSGINTITGTNHLAAAASCSSFSNGDVKHGPFGLNVPSLSWNAVEALSWWEIKIYLTRASARHSQRIVRIHLDVPGLSSIFSYQMIQHLTRR